MDKKKPKVLVMMATYNGERYLKEQVDSILAQEAVDVMLWINDDQSTDGTVAIGEEYASIHDNVHFRVNNQNLGPKRNFMSMVFNDNLPECDLYAFSDQDDVWVPNKLSFAAHALSRVSIDEPALWFSDVENVDMDTGITSRHISRSRVCEGYPGDILVRNWVNGCAMVMNRAMIDLVRSWEPPSYPRYHDAWVHAIARFCGTVVPDYDHVMVRRRVGGHNVLGEENEGWNNPKAAIESAKRLSTEPNRGCSEMAQLLWEGFSDVVKPELIPLLEDFLSYRYTAASRLHIVMSRLLRMPTMRLEAQVRVKLLLGRF